MVFQNDTEIPCGSSFFVAIISERMEKQMKHDKPLWGSISFLIGAVILILVLTRGTLQVALLIGLFSIWGIWTVGFLLLPYMRRSKRHMQRRQQIKTLQAAGISPANPLSSFNQGAEPVELLLLRHVNHRISAYLKAVYPDVKWEWCEKNPERIIRQGGVGRIRVFGAADFDHADVTVDQQANITCNMIHIVPLANTLGGTDGSESLPPNKQPVDPQIWYELQGRKVLEALVADLNSRGHSSLTLHENGDICTTESDAEVAREHLANFPEKLYWPRLVQVFERNGLAAEITAEGIQVSW